MSSTARAPSLRVGFVPGVTPDKWARRWAERHPRSPLHLVPVEESQQRDALMDGVVDACFVRGEIDRDGLHVIKLYDEQPVVVVGQDHPASVFAELTVGDLADEVLWEITPNLSAKDAVATVAAGTGVVILPLSLARLLHRKDVVAVRLLDAPETPVALAFRRETDGPALQELVGVVRGRTARSSRS